LGYFGNVAGWVLTFSLNKFATEFGQFFGAMLNNLADSDINFFQKTHPTGFVLSFNRFLFSECLINGCSSSLMPN